MLNTVRIQLSSELPQTSRFLCKQAYKSLSLSLPADWKARRTRRRRATLIEVIIACTVISVGLIRGSGSFSEHVLVDEDVGSFGAVEHIFVHWCPERRETIANGDRMRAYAVSH